MARTRVGRGLPRTKREKVIKMAAQRNDLTMPMLAAKSGIGERTFYNRLKEPGRITLDELHWIDNKLHFTDEEILCLIGRAK